MNRNGQARYLDHLIRVRSEPQRAAEFQAEMNAYRRKRVLDALSCRPVFIPLEFSLPAAGQVTPIRDTTQQLGYDVLVTAAKSDCQDRDIIVRSLETDRSIVRIGDETDLYLRADEFAGQIPGNGGQTGPFYFPTPIVIRRNNRVTVEMFKTDTTDDAEEKNIILIGNRVFPRGYGDQVVLDPHESQLIERAIMLDEVPRTSYLKVVVDFDSAVQGGEARNIYTPRSEEPLLLRGIRSSLRYSSIELGLQGEPTWTTEATPVWAIAAEDEVGHDNFQWFSKPIYLPVNSSVEIRRVVNGHYSHDSSLIDAETGNTITFICESV